jgi:hypothetical protein
MNKPQKVLKPCLLYCFPHFNPKFINGNFVLDLSSSYPLDETGISNPMPFMSRSRDNDPNSVVLI